MFVATELMFFLEYHGSLIKHLSPDRSQFRETQFSEKRPNPLFQNMFTCMATTFTYENRCDVIVTGVHVFG